MKTSPPAPPAPRRRRASAPALLAATLTLGVPGSRAAAGPPAGPPAPWGAPELVGDGGLPVDPRRPLEDPLPVRVRTPEGVVSREVGDCGALLDLGEDLVGADTDATWRVVRYEIATCQALALLAQARPAARTALPPDLADLRKTDLWPGSLWPAVSPDEAASPAPADLRVASGRRRWHAEAPGALTLRTREDELTATLLVRGDLDGDGWEDLALRWQASLPGGTWADTELVVVTRVSPGASLSVLPLASLLP